MKKAILWIVLIIIVILGVVALGNGDKKGEKVMDETGPIKIGFIGPLTGDGATLGENSLMAAKVAVSEINAAGGINGRTVELIAEDGQCSGQPSNSAANKLINVDKVDVILGGFCSAETLSFTDMAEDAGVPVVSPVSSSPSITDAGDYIFRVYPSDSFQGVFAADFMKNELGLNKVAVLYTQDDWGNGLQDVFVKHFKSIGGEVVAIESFQKTSRDLRTQIAKIKDSGAEAIYFLAFSEASVPGITQLRDAGIEVPVMGGDPWADPSIWESVGDAGEGFLYPEVAVLNSPDFANKLAEVGAEPVVSTSQTYDIVKIFEEVIGKVGTDKEAIKNALYKVSYTGGVSSNKIEFDDNGDLKQADYIVKVIKDGVAVERE